MTACRNNIEVQPHALASARAVPGCLRKFTWGQTVGNRNAQISIRVIDAGDIHAHERSSLLSCSIDLEAGARRLGVYFGIAMIVSVVSGVGAWW